MNIYCLHLKKLIEEINFIMSANKMRDLFDFLLNKKTKYNDSQILIWDETLSLDFD